MRFRIVFLLLLLFQFSLMSQEPEAADKKLKELFQQRESLYRRASISYEQKNALFGGKSKKDLKETIDELERIIKKDNEIIEEVQLLRRGKDYQSNRLENRVVEDVRRVAELEKSNLKLRADIRKLKEELANTDSKIEDIKKGKLMFILISLFLFILLILSFFYKRKRK